VVAARMSAALGMSILTSERERVFVRERGREREGERDCERERQ
jgi:hypothetical protein